MEDEVVSGKKVSRTDIVVLFAAAIASSIAVRYIFTNPDAARTINMRLARVVKRIAERQVDSWQRVADGAATFYNKQRIAN